MYVYVIFFSYYGYFYIYVYLCMCSERILIIELIMYFLFWNGLKYYIVIEIIEKVWEVLGIMGLFRLEVL